MPSARAWYLEGIPEEGARPGRFLVGARPTVIGRHPDADVRLLFPNVSSQHAELHVQEGRLYLRDLGSRNGTFVNRERLEHGDPLELADGDLLHIASHELRVSCVHALQEILAQTEHEALRPTDLPDGIHSSLERFRQMLMRRAVRPVYQPVVDLESRDVLGYEVLGRGQQPGLAAHPMALFQLAQMLDVECELSELFRDEGLRIGSTLPGAPALFVNTHPAELDELWVLDSLRRARRACPDTRLVVELHEACVTSPEQTRALRAGLEELGMELAYDDFGAGRSRLVELVEVPPDFLKFDLSLIRGIDEASAGKQRMIEVLVKMVRDEGIRCLAEGIETEGELQACRQLGFELGQGYYLGRPSPLSHWTNKTELDLG